MNNLAYHQPCPDNCGSSDAYSEYVDDNGHKRGKCHSCDYKIWFNAFDAIQLNKKSKEQVGLPIDRSDLQLGIPYLSSYDITYEDAKAYKLRFYNGNGWLELPNKKWLKYNKAVLFPIYDQDNNINYYQIKSFGPVAGAKTYTVGQKSVLCKSVTTNKSTDVCVIVEDYISMMKVGKVLPCVALLGGAEFSRQALEQLLALNYFTYVIWTDNDRGGVKISKKLFWRLGAFGKCTNIVSPDHARTDPKDYSHKEIKQLIERVL